MGTSDLEFPGKTAPEEGVYIHSDGRKHDGQPAEFAM
jgi:hypothetical protein